MQAPDSSYCWACCAVSAGQYKAPSIIYSAEDIAIEYAGSLNIPKPMSTIKSIIRQKYSRIYSPYSQDLTYAIVQTNINNDRPMVAYVSYNGNGGHFFVVRGYHIPGSGTSYLVIMDPLAGNRLLSQSSNGASSTQLLYWNEGKTTTYPILNSIGVY